MLCLGALRGQGLSRVSTQHNGALNSTGAARCSHSINKNKLMVPLQAVPKFHAFNYQMHI